MKSLRGLGVALVTPFSSSGSIDYVALEKLLQHTATGVDYYVVMGSTGEASTLSSKEQFDVLEFVKQHNPKNLPIVFGLGGNNTKEMIQRLQNLNLTGVTAILSSSPAYNKPTQNGIEAHFTALADTSPIPIILYNVPGRTASNMEASTTISLAKHKNIIGIKEASGNVRQAMEIAAHTADFFLVLSGDDLLTPAIAAVGGHGLISVLANAMPTQVSSMVHAALSGNFKESSTQASKLSAVDALMYEEGNPTGIKALLALKTICSPFVRLPLVRASDNLSKKIKDTVSKA